MAKENRGSNKSDQSKQQSAARKEAAQKPNAKVFGPGQKTPHMDGRGQSGQPKR